MVVVSCLKGSSFSSNFGLTTCRPADGAALLVAAASSPAAAQSRAVFAKPGGVDENHGVALSTSPSKHHSLKTEKDRKKEKEKKNQKKKRHKERSYDSSLAGKGKSQPDINLRLSAAQLKASVEAMRKERVAREAQERLRQQNLLRHNFRK